MTGTLQQRPQPYWYSKSEKAGRPQKSLEVLRPAPTARGSMSDPLILKEQAMHLRGELHGKSSTIMLYKMEPVLASVAAKAIVDFTEENGPDPFEPNFPFINNWLGKKENKGKKEWTKKWPRDREVAKEIREV